jgi:hypothetical protein
MTQTATWTVEEYYKALEEGRYKEVIQPAGRLVSGGVLAGFSIEIGELFNFPAGIDETEFQEETEASEQPE